MKYGGKKKSKRKTKKRTKLTKRIRKLPSKKQRGGETPEQLTKSLYRAIKDNNVNEVNASIDRGADVNVPYGSKYPVELASHDGKLEIVKILIANRANVNTVNTNRWGILFHPALTWASIMGHTEVVKLLLNADADPLFVSYGNVSALQMATDNGFTEIVRLINNRIRSNNYLTARLVTDRGTKTPTHHGYKYPSRLLPTAQKEIGTEIASFLPQKPNGGKRIRKSNESKRYRRKTTKKRRSKRQSRKN